MSAIYIYHAVVDTCYKHQADNRDLGKFLRTDSRVRNSGAGALGQTRAPIYVFEKETIQDKYPPEMIIPVTCPSIGGRRKSVRRKKNRRSKYSRRTRK
jgi:hypothetical protein